MGPKMARDLTSSGRGVVNSTAFQSSTPLVELNHQKCDEVAHVLGGQPVPAEEEEIQLPQLPQVLVGNFFLALVAICHQTSPPGKPSLEGIVQGSRRKGWDYLFARFQEAASALPEFVTPQHLA